MNSKHKTMHFVVMGICGCGKTTIAKAIEEKLNCQYAEGDEFHTQHNREKMGAGIPLDDEDRYPWLRNIRDWMSEQANNGNQYTVVTCSALKKKYRDILREAKGEVVFVHLSPPIDVNLARIKERKGHYMKANMLDSQTEILEELGIDELGVKINSAGQSFEVEAEIYDWFTKSGYFI